MNKTTTNRASLATEAETAGTVCAGSNSSSSDCRNHATAPQQKTKLEKTQSILTIASTSVGLLGIAGSVCSIALATFYTGVVEVSPTQDAAGLVVKVYTKEGHESVFHSRHLELMPGDYHLEVNSPEGKVAHFDTKVQFHKTNVIPVSFSAQNEAESSSAAEAKKMQKKRHWWQFWRHSDAESDSSNKLGEQ